jgi:hypothetical protein
LSGPVVTHLSAGDGDDGNSNFGPEDDGGAVDPDMNKLRYVNL